MTQETTTLAMWKFLVTKPNSISDLNATMPDITAPLQYENPILYQMHTLDGPLLVDGLMQQYDKQLAPENTRVNLAGRSPSGKMSLFKL